MVKIARLNRKLQFLKANGFTQDPGGNLVPVYSPSFKRWVNVKYLPRTNEEVSESDVNAAIVRVKLTTRYTKKITHDMRFALDDLIFSIKSVGDLDGDREFSVIYGEVRLDGGY